MGECIILLIGYTLLTVAVYFWFDQYETGNRIVKGELRWIIKQSIT